MQRTAAAVTPASFTAFGELLRYLRRRAYLTQRDLGIATGYSEAQISRLEKNQRLPDPTALLALFVPALDLDNQPDWATRLLALAAVARGQPEPQHAPAGPVPAEATGSLEAIPPRLPTKWPDRRRWLAWRPVSPPSGALPCPGWRAWVKPPWRRPTPASAPPVNPSSG
jgi:transcriptional regulator with XRE-family HTH domain